MQVIDRLPAIAAAIDDDAVATVELELFGQIADHQPHVSDQILILIGERGDRLDRALGDDQNMRGRLAGDVVKGEALVIFKDDLGRDFFVDDPLKDGFLGHGNRRRVYLLFEGVAS